MNQRYKSHVLFSILVLCISILSCGGGTQTPPPPPPEEDCQGNVYVDKDTVKRVAPSPTVTLSQGSTTTWDVPPFAIDVTGTGKAILQIFDALNNLLGKYNVYAATTTSGKVTVAEWNGLKAITFNAGNFYVDDSGGQDQCKIQQTALGVKITSVGTTYILTVRPELEQVVIAVLDGMLRVESQGIEVILNAEDPAAQMVVVTGGAIGPLQPLPTDPESLQTRISNGEDIITIEPPPGEVPPPAGSLTVWTDESLIPVISELGAQFEQDTGMQVFVVGIPVEDRVDRFINSVAAGAAPDIISIPHERIYNLALDGLIAPIEPGLDPGMLIPGTIQAFNVQGTIFAAPYVYHNLALVSNPQLVTEIPSSWYGVLEYASACGAGEVSIPCPIIIIPDHGYFFYPVQSAFGGYIFAMNEDGSYNPAALGIDDPGSLSSATWLEEFANTTAYSSRNYVDAMQDFKNGSAWMVITGPWVLPELRAEGIPYRIDPFPGQDRDSQPLLTVDGFAVSNTSEFPGLARDFVLQYLTRMEAMQAYALSMNKSPARWDALEGLKDDDLRSFGYIGAGSVPIPNIPQMGSVWDPWTSAVQAVMVGELSGDQAFHDAAEKIRSMISE